MIKYQYKRVVNCSDKEMNEAGQFGWECYQIMPMMPDSPIDRTYFFLKNS